MAGFSRQSSWLAPFLCLGLIALVLWRPWPVFPPPAHTHLVTDASGARVAVPKSPRLVVGRISDFLQKTRAPERIFKVSDDRGDFMSWLYGKIYPQIARDDRLWDIPNDIESIVAWDSGNSLYVDGGDPRFGMVGFDTWPSGPLFDGFSGLRALCALLGQKAQGEAIMAEFKQGFADLQNDLQPQTLTAQPRAISLAAPAEDWTHLSAEGLGDPPIGIRDGSDAMIALGRGSEAERVLAMNPDMIVLRVGDVHEFFRDPRWQGLKATRDHRVFGNILDLNSRLMDDTDNPPWAERWLAEIAHPDRLHPKLRMLLRAYYVKSYGYRFSDDEIDDLLRVKDNSASAGYERFSRNAGAEGPL